MHLSLKFAVLAILAQVALINASPVGEQGYYGDLAARGPTKVPTQQECEVACTLAGHQGAAWQQCVNQCMASNYPSPPPTPPPAGNQRKPQAPANKPQAPANKPKGPARKKVARGPTKVPTQQECEVACTLAGFQGAAWQQCVNQCMAGNYPSPPPTPPPVGNQRKPQAPANKPQAPANKPKGPARKKVARGPTKVPTQQECEVACTLAGFQGAAWQQCVNQCMAGNYPSPPPTPPPVGNQRKPQAPANKPQAPANKPKGPARKKVARGPTKVPTQQECEVACTLAGFQGAAWQQCVNQCMAGNYPSPPPTPPPAGNQRKPQAPANKPQAPANKPKGPARKKVARGPTKVPTQQECEVACTLAGHQGAAWQQCVNQCMASNYPSPPPSPQPAGNQRKPQAPAAPAKQPKVKKPRGVDFFEDFE